MFIIHSAWDHFVYNKYHDCPCNLLGCSAVTWIACSMPHATCYVACQCGMPQSALTFQEIEALTAIKVHCNLDTDNII